MVFNQFFAIPSLVDDEAAGAVASAISQLDPHAVMQIDAAAQMVRVASGMRAGAIALSISAAGHPVSSWAEEMRRADSLL